MITFGKVYSTDNNLKFRYLEYKNSKGSLIFNLSNKKLIGIHNENGIKSIHKALFFKSIIDAFSLKYKPNLFTKFNLNLCTTNEINIIIKVE